MATNNSSANSSPANFPKSPKSPRQLPQLPTLSGQRSPNQLSAGCGGGGRSPSTPRVFEFPPEFCPPTAAETPNTNFDFEDFVSAVDLKSPQEFSIPKSPSLYGSSSSAGPKSPASARRAKSPIFQFCNPRRNISKTQSYPPKSPLSPSVSVNSVQTTGSLKYSGSKSSSKPAYSGNRRRNSSLSLGPNGPISPSIITPTSGCVLPNPQNLEGSARVSPSDEQLRDSSPSPGGSGSAVGKVQEHAGARSANWHRESLKMRTRQPRPAAEACYLNKSQGCLNEVMKKEVRSDSSVKSERNMSRKSTSDLTEVNDADTEVTILSSPRRRGSMKGGLAYLASRRGSRDSQASNLSNVSNEEIGPLNFSAHPRGRQRRTSNFLELPDITPVQQKENFRESFTLPTEYLLKNKKTKLAAKGKKKLPAVGTSEDWLQIQAEKERQQTIKEEKFAKKKELQETKKKLAEEKKKLQEQMKFLQQKIKQEAS